jgi:hypothetical protein
MENMSRIEKIEEAIQQLSPEEFTQLAKWIQEMDQDRWDKQLDTDAQTGKLDFLFDEAREEKRNGLLKTWPPTS